MQHVQPVSHIESAKVIVVDDERATLVAIEGWLTERRMKVIGVQTREQAVQLASKFKPQLAIIDYRLATGPDGIRLGAQMSHEYRVPFVLISGFLSTPLVVNAMKAGAVDVLEKPLQSRKFVTAIERALLEPVSEDGGRVTSLAVAAQSPVGTLEAATVRWARMVIAACEASEDPRTVRLWARTAGVSSSTIEETCRLCGVRTRNARDLARFLRALARDRSANDLKQLFAVADHRTLARLFDRAGLSLDGAAPSLRDCLMNQEFVPKDLPCFRELAHLAANSPHFLRTDNSLAG